MVENIVKLVVDKRGPPVLDGCVAYKKSYLFGTYMYERTNCRNIFLRPLEQEKHQSFF